MLQSVVAHALPALKPTAYFPYLSTLIIHLAPSCASPSNITDFHTIHVYTFFYNKCMHVYLCAPAVLGIFEIVEPLLVDLSASIDTQCQTFIQAVIPACAVLGQDLFVKDGCCSADCASAVAAVGLLMLHTSALHAFRTRSECNTSFGLFASLSLGLACCRARQSS